MTIESQGNLNIKNNEISLRDLIFKIQEWWRYLMSKWLIILMFGLLGGALGFYYAYKTPTVYTATTTFVLEDEKAGGSGLGSLAGLASMAGVDVGGGSSMFQGDNLIELYKSRKMLVQTLLTEIAINGKKQSLVDRYIDFNSLKKNWLQKPALNNLQFINDSLADGRSLLKRNRSRDSILIEIAGDISKNYLFVGKADKKIDIIRVDIKAQDEIFAKAFNDALVKNVNDFYLQTSIKKSLQNVKIMQQKTDSVRAVMNGAIYASVAVADATPNLNLTRLTQRAAPAQRAQFSAETNKAILSSLVQNLEMSKLTLMKETPLLEVLDYPVYPLEKRSLSRMYGIVVGGFLLVFISSSFLVIKLIITNILKQH